MFFFFFVFDRKMQVSGASDLASKAQVSSETSNLKVKGEPVDSFRPQVKVRCVCGSSLETDSMIQVKILRKYSAPLLLFLTDDLICITVGSVL